MALTFKNFASTLSPDLLQQAKKNQVRECDEAQKGYFVAYVDDGSESFDVSLTIKSGNEIIVHTCECNSKASFCRHKTALLIHIAEGKKPKSTIKVKNKVSLADAMLEDADPAKLKDWVRGLISKNKDIELSFVHYFAAKEQLTPAEVEKIVNDAVKAVTGKKKTIDATQLKKLVELWDDTLTPIAEQYYADVTGEKPFKNFHAIVENCVAFWFKIDTASNKISKFVEEVQQKSIAPISNLQVEEAWDKAVGYLIDHVQDGANGIRVHYLNHLKSIVEASSNDRKIKIVDRLVKQLKETTTEKLTNGSAYRKFIFSITDENNLFPKYSHVFKPIPWENSYNERLIELLIANNHLIEAKKYCIEQINSNTKDEYSVPYLKLLKEIHLIQNDDDELAKVLTALFPYSFDFEDYLFILKRMPEEEAKKWRTKMLAQARKLSTWGRKEPTVFCFELANSEANYRKMIEYINSYTTYDMIHHYFVRMVSADKHRLMDVILRKSDNNDWNIKKEDREKDAACFPELFKLFEKHYGADYIKMAIHNKKKDGWYFSPNSFTVFMKKQLGI